MPIAVAILIGVFAIQRHGTHRVGRLFGPIMVGWFLVIAALGIVWLVQQPVVLTAVDPRHALAFFREHGWHGFAVLGAVFLVVTGGEALYADMGHFGRRPIRIAWFALVLPALLLNYFGQGALLLSNPQAAEQPFFLLAPEWALFPLVGLATAAAIIASQALISGAFSLTRQAIQLGYCPRLDIEHTSSHEIGQVYVPQVNWALMVSTIAIVIGFGSSTALAAAYGIAVTLTMVITAVLLHVVATERWRWPPAAGARRDRRVPDGGSRLLRRECPEDCPRRMAAAGHRRAAVHADDDVEDGTADRRAAAHGAGGAARGFHGARRRKPPARVPGTAVFMTAQPRGTPPALAHNLRYNKVLHEHVVTLMVTTQPVPHVSADASRSPSARLARASSTSSSATVSWRIRTSRRRSRSPANAGSSWTTRTSRIFLGRETLIVTRAPGMAMWRERLFVLMARNAVRATAFFRLPPERVVELGVQVEL